MSARRTAWRKSDRIRLFAEIDRVRETIAAPAAAPAHRAERRFRIRPAERPLHTEFFRAGCGAAGRRDGTGQADGGRDRRRGPNGGRTNRGTGLGPIAAIPLGCVQARGCVTRVVVADLAARRSTDAHTVRDRSAIARLALRHFRCLHSFGARIISNPGRRRVAGGVARVGGADRRPPAKRLQQRRDCAGGR